MSNNIYLKCKDYSVSGEEFQLIHNEELDMLTTFPIPDLSKLGKYYESEDYISHTDSRMSFFDRVYQLVKNYTIGRKVKLLSMYCSVANSEAKVLDIGCGTGDFLLGCKKSRFNVVGVEPNESARLLAESKLSTTVISDLSDLKGDKFDFITMWHVLEHVPNLFEYVENLKLLLRDNGTLIIAVPNFKSYDAKYYQEFWAAYDVPRHLSHFSKSSISKLFSKVGMNVENFIPMKFDSFYVSLLSEKYKNNKMNIFKAFLIGFRSNVRAKWSGEYSSLIYIIKNH